MFKTPMKNTFANLMIRILFLTALSSFVTPLTNSVLAAPASPTIVVAIDAFGGTAVDTVLLPDSLPVAASDSELGESTLDSSKQLIKSLVDYYQPESVRRFGQSIELNFMDQKIRQMIGGRRNGKLVVEVYSGVYLLSNATLSFITCHELGHILGSVPISVAYPPLFFYDTRDNVEGEADYFGGGCVREYLSRSGLTPVSGTVKEESIKAIEEAMELIYHKKSEPERALDEKYAWGIASSYPNQDCRTLSAIAGVLGDPRPKCWFNKLI